MNGTDTRFNEFCRPEELGNIRVMITGFWECPELFELPVDGDKNHTKWVMYGASGTYMLGSFDGQTFTPEAGKYYYYTEACMLPRLIVTYLPVTDVAYK